MKQQLLQLSLLLRALDPELCDYLGKYKHTFTINVIKYMCYYYYLLEGWIRGGMICLIFVVVFSPRLSGQWFTLFLFPMVTDLV